MSIMKVTGDSIDERLEKFNSFKDHSPKYQKRGVQLNINDNITIVRERQESDNTLHKEWFYTHNLVTSEGDIYYANKITLKKGDGTAYGDTDFVTDNRFFHHDGTTVVSTSDKYGCMILGSGTLTPNESDTYSSFSAGAYDASHLTINTTKTLNANYPRFNDNDADNTGGATDQVTWSYSWTKNDFTTVGANDLTGGVIVDRNKLATPAGTAKLLCHFNFASPFEKTANDTLKVFVNHTFEGA